MSRREHDRKDDFPADLIDADEAIDLVIDGVLIGSKRLRKKTKRILRMQKQLRAVVDTDTWKVFLKLEELFNERASKQADILVRWALAHGARLRR